MACGGSDDKKDDPVISGKTYTKSVTLDAQGTEQTVTLNDLKSKIDDVSNSYQWLTVRIDPYTSGSPSVAVSAEANTGTDARSGNVTITAISGDKVILTVAQNPAPTPHTYGIDDPHDTESDQSAYSRRR